MPPRIWKCRLGSRSIRVSRRALYLRRGVFGSDRVVESVVRSSIPEIVATSDWDARFSIVTNNYITMA